MQAEYFMEQEQILKLPISIALWCLSSMIPEKDCFIDKKLWKSWVEVAGLEPMGRPDQKSSVVHVSVSVFWGSFLVEWFGKLDERLR